MPLEKEGDSNLYPPPPPPPPPLRMHNRGRVRRPVLGTPL